MSDEISEVPYVEDPDDPIYEILDLESFSKVLLKEGYRLFCEMFKSEHREVMSDDELKELDGEDLERILPIELSVDACKRKLPYSTNEDGEKIYAINKETMQILIPHIAEEIYHFHCQMLVDDGVLEMVYSQSEEGDQIGYKMKGQPDNE